MKLYDGEVEITLDESNYKHQYIVTDKGQRVYPVSVTTILSTLAKPALVPWAVNKTIQYLDEELRKPWAFAQLDRILQAAKYAHNRHKSDAAEIGTNAHAWMENYWKGVDQPMPDPGPVRNCVVSAIEGINKHHIVPIAVERPVYSRRLNIAGRMDLLAKIDGKLAILDYKSNRTKIYEESAFQLAAYAEFYREETGESVESRWLWKLGKEDGSFEDKEHTLETQMLDLVAFEGAYDVYQRLKQLRRKPKPNWLDEMLEVV